MEETPEEVLARLERYVDSLSARARDATTGAALVADGPRLHSFGTLSRTLVGQFICVATCIVTIVLWINVGHAVAYVAAAATAVMLGIGLTRRLPFTGWALVGLVLGLALGILS
jgi:hypothetical protein